MVSCVVSSSVSLCLVLTVSVTPQEQLGVVGPVDEERQKQSSFGETSGEGAADHKELTELRRGDVQSSGRTRSRRQHRAALRGR